MAVVKPSDKFKLLSIAFIRYINHSELASWCAWQRFRIIVKMQKGGIYQVYKYKKGQRPFTSCLPVKQLLLLHWSKAFWFCLRTENPCTVFVQTTIVSKTFFFSFCICNISQKIIKQKKWEIVRFFVSSLSLSFGSLDKDFVFCGQHWRITWPELREINTM